MKPLYVKEIFEPKTYDIDYAGIVSNQVYVRWLEDLRFMLIKKYYDWSFLKEDIIPVITKTEIYYIKSVKLNEIVKAEMWMEGIRGPRFILKSEMKKSDTITVCRAIQEGVFLNSTTGRILRVPKELKKHFDNNEK